MRVKKQSFNAGDRVMLVPREEHRLGDLDSMRKYGYPPNAMGTVLDSNGAGECVKVQWDCGVHDPRWIPECLEFCLPQEVMPDTRDYLNALAEYEGRIE